MKPEDINDRGEEQASRVAYLVAGYIAQTLTEKEHDELDDWMTSSDENQVLFEELTDPGFIRKGLSQGKNRNADKVLGRIKSRINTLREGTENETGIVDEGIARSRKKWRTYSIAASLILLTGLTIFFMTNKKTGPVREIVTKSLINPGGNYAMLTLANGRVINLNEAKNGLLDSTNGNEVLKTADGQISYENVPNELMKYHLLSTPAGGQYSVMLPDGSRVWLNSLSSLKYPVMFAEGDRIVELTGEGYFEVAQSTSFGKGGSKKTPFIVKVNGMNVKVLGTHFNINAYDDEPVVKTTLLEGKVVVSLEPEKSGNAGNEKPAGRELKPGEQARMDKGGFITISNDEDADEVVAWKNGMFMFKDLMIDELMREVSRWYAAEIVYEGKVDHHFNATIYRKEPVERLLNILEETNEVHFRVEGRKIYVSR